MGNSFDYFVKKIPINIHNNTKSIISTNIAIFIPEKFIINKKLNVEEYHFVICFTTPPRVIIGEEEYSFKKGSLITMSPGDEVTLYPLDSNSPSKYITICVNKDYFQNVYLKMGGKGNILIKRLDNTYSYQLLEAIEALIYEINNYEATNFIMIESLENRIAIQLMRDSNLELELPINKSHNEEDYIQKAIKYIETYYSSNITIKDICDNIYISPPYFQRIFLKIMGKTPYQYIMECRHNKAKELIKNPDISIEEIARQCGFVNRAHFSTAFKLKEGIPPLEYRKLVKST